MIQEIDTRKQERGKVIREDLILPKNFPAYLEAECLKNLVLDIRIERELLESIRKAEG